MRELRKAYGDLVAVDGVSFEVSQGEVFGLLGPNGAGKTTTLEILEGLRQPDGGHATVLGLDVSRPSTELKEHIGVQLQSAALYPKLTVTELLELFGSLYRRRRPSAELIAQFNLEDRRDALTGDLSGGQRQRLSIALALVNNPQLIFLDEPTTGLDPQARRSLWSHIGGLRDEGRTILLTTHYMEEAELLCDRLAIMDHGRILASGTVRELIAGHSTDRSIRFEHQPQLGDALIAQLPGVRHVVHENGEVALFTSDVAATIAALLEAADHAGVGGLDVAVRRPSVEDVFLDLTGRALRD